MGNIRLSPKYGVNPTMLVCPICGEPTGELALMGRINDETRKADIEAPKYSMGNNPCDKCQEWLDKGYKILLETEDIAIRGEKKRTGRFMVLKPESLPNFPHQIAYCEHTLYEQILEQGSNDGNKA